MRNLFAIVVVLFFVNGCYLSHERPLPVTPMEDSGPFIGGDAGQDTGPIPVGECVVGETRHCYSGLPSETEGVGQCHGSEQRCIPATDGSGRWERSLIDCVGEVTPYPMGDIPRDGIDNDCDGETDEDPGLPSGEPIVEFYAPASDELTVGVQRVRLRIRSTGAPIGVKRAHIGLSVHPYNEDAPMREGWNWERRFQVGWYAIWVERDGVTADDIDTHRWSFVHSPFSHAIVVVFPNEELIDMDGHEYVVNVPVTGDLDPGDRIGFDLNTVSGAIGSLTPDGTTFGPYGWRAPNIYNGGGSCEDLPSTSPYVFHGQFVWSNRMAPDHNDADCLSGGSADWWSGTLSAMGGGYELTAR